MKKTMFFFALLIAIAASGLNSGVARADGFIFPDPPICPAEYCIDPPCPPPPPCPVPPLRSLAVRYHHVDVVIENQVALTRVDQVFYNPNDVPIEGTYLFPLPVDATVTSFKLWVDGQAVEGKVLEADEARRQYEEIVASLRDPALLEYADRGAVQARIFPIPAGGERRVEIDYVQPLTEENGLVGYDYPLNTEKFSAYPLDSVVINVEIRSIATIRAVYSPTHPVSIQHEQPNLVRVGYEANHVLPDQDFSLIYSLGENEAFHLFSLLDPGDASDEDGFFLLLLGPKPEAGVEISAKDILVVLDRSGSMEGEKFQQGLSALEYILDHLNPDDRFNILAFSTDVISYADSLRPTSEVAEARPWVKKLSAEGSTDIHSALLKAVEYVDESRPTYLIFITDGLPTVGVIDSSQILADFQRESPENLRCFAFGVGYDVDTYLLDSLTQEHHGVSHYVSPEENLDLELTSFYEKIRTPVMTNLELDFGNLDVYDMYPKPLPDLFSGSQIVVVGRYRGGGNTDIRLSGKVNGEIVKFEYKNLYFSKGVESRSLSPALKSIPRLWATRKIGYLLNQIRLKGADEESVGQIVSLSIRYGIVTPYTSYLVTEPMPLGADEQSRIVGEEMQGLGAAPAMETSGMDAVLKAAEQGALAGAEAPKPLDEEISQQIKVVGTRTFVNQSGVWTDTAFDPARMSTKKVAYLSEDYFALANTHASLAAAFALGERVIAMYQGVAYEVVAEDTVVEPITIATPAVTEEPVIEPVQPKTEEPSASKPVCIGAIILFFVVVFGRRIL